MKLDKKKLQNLILEVLEEEGTLPGVQKVAKRMEQTKLVDLIQQNIKTPQAFIQLMQLAIRASPLKDDVELAALRKVLGAAQKGAQSPPETKNQEKAGQI